MASPISKRELEHLAALARVKLSAAEEEKLLKDLEKILNHVAELNELDTRRVAPATGGTMLQNIFRDDAERERTNRGAGADAFPETRDGFLKVPPVFE